MEEKPFFYGLSEEDAFYSGLFSLGGPWAFDEIGKTFYVNSDDFELAKRFLYIACKREPSIRNETEKIHHKGYTVCRYNEPEFPPEARGKHYFTQDDDDDDVYNNIFRKAKFEYMIQRNYNNRWGRGFPTESTYGHDVEQTLNKFIENCTPNFILSVGCGECIIETYLEKRVPKIVCTDIEPPNSKTEKLSAIEAVKKYTDADSLLIVWPHPSAKGYEHVVENFAGQYIIFIGNFHMNGDTDPRDCLIWSIHENNWKIIMEGYDIPGSNSGITILKRD